MEVNQETDKYKCKKSKVGEICLRKDNIITFVPNLDITSTNINIIKSDLITYLDLTKETGPLPFLTDNRILNKMTPEERLFIQHNLPKFASKIAIIVKTGLSQYFYNIMSYLNKPDIPMKSFTNIEQALKWLKS